MRPCSQDAASSPSTWPVTVAPIIVRPATGIRTSIFSTISATVVRWFGWSSVDLLGHSLGATLVSVFAAICPDRVGRLLLIEGLGPLTHGRGQDA